MTQFDSRVRRKARQTMIVDFRLPIFDWIDRTAKKGSSPNRQPSMALTKLPVPGPDLCLPPPTVYTSHSYKPPVLCNTPASFVILPGVRYSVSSIRPENKPFGSGFLIPDSHFPAPALGLGSGPISLVVRHSLVSVNAFIFSENRHFFRCKLLKTNTITRLALFPEFLMHLAHIAALNSIGFVWLRFSSFPESLIGAFIFSEKWP
jgi:hypothetical protein